jgi:hypothetical protein
MKSSKDFQSGRSAGGPVCGSEPKTTDRHEARPVSSPHQKGLDADRPRRCGR